MSDLAERIRSYLAAAGYWDPEFQPLVNDLVDLREIRDQTVERAKAQPVVFGSKGQERENPALDTAWRAHDRILRLSDELLLTPKSRARAGIAPELVDDLFAELDARGPFDRLQAQRLRRERMGSGLEAFGPLPNARPNAHRSGS